MLVSVKKYEESEAQVDGVHVIANKKLLLLNVPPLAVH